MTALRRSIDPDASPRRKIGPILAAARAVFLEHGFADASMDAVARLSGVSKATLYVYFPGKRELFAAIILAERDDFSAALLAAEASATSIRGKLRKVGHAVMAFLLSKDTIASYRMVVAESGRSPELGRDFHSSGPANLLGGLAELIQRSMDRGALRKADPRVAAEHFIGLVRGDLQLLALLGVRGGLARTRVDSVVRSGVDAFYRAYQPDGAEARAPGESSR